MTPEQRRLRAKIAANARWSHPAARADQSEAARSAIFARLERQIDPDGTLPPDQRAVLVRSAARRLSAQLNAAKARKKRTAMTLSRCAAGPENRVDVMSLVQTLLQITDTAPNREQTLPVRITEVTERVAARLPVQ